MIHAMLRRQSGGFAESLAIHASKKNMREISIEAGGALRQIIRRDRNRSEKWDTEKVIPESLRLFGAA